MRCQICQEQLTNQPDQKDWNGPHLKTVHPEFVEWRARWTKTFLILGTIDVAILVTFLILVFRYWILNPTLQVATALIGVLLYSVPVVTLMMQYLRRVAHFKQEWREQHPIT